MARITPARVACTPDFNRETHIIIPKIIYKLFSETPRLFRKAKTKMQIPEMIKAKIESLLV